MFGLTQRARIGLVIAAVATATTTGLFAGQAATAEAAVAAPTTACYERYVAGDQREGHRVPWQPGDLEELHVCVERLRLLHRDRGAR